MLAKGHAACAAALAIALLLAGCGGSKPAGGRKVQAPYQLSGPACIAGLRARGIAVTPWRTSPRRSCPVDTAVRATTDGTARLEPPLETSCAMLTAWSDFEHEVQAAARLAFNQRVVAIRHYGSYACRAMTGNAGRLSLHAEARALDIAAFQLRDGTLVTVADGWKGSRAQRRFLQAVAEAACRHFSVILTPASDADHRDHLHVDIGPWRACGL